MEKFVAVIDYGLGNLRSVSKALETVGAKAKVTNKTKDMAEAYAIVLPGVGAFKRAMDNLAKLDIIPSILAAIKDGKPFLGICLGLQVLFTESQEHGSHRGLDIIKGKVKPVRNLINDESVATVSNGLKKFSSGMKIPHMGWNNVRLKAQSSKLKVFKDIPDGSYFYFVHSYYVEPEDENTVVATTGYGQEFVCAINKDNVWGLQFHPEKSERLGLEVLRNFISLC